MDELLIKNAFTSTKEKHIAIREDENIASISSSTNNQSFKFANSAYKVSFNTGLSMEFIQSPRFTVGNAIYNIYEDTEWLGNINRKSLKSEYEVEIDGTRYFIGMGWVMKQNVEYTNYLGNEIAIEKGLTVWKMRSETEIQPVDTSVALFIRAMSELKQ